MKPILYLLILVLFISCNNSSQSVSEWRGLDRSGIYQEVNLLKAWSESGPELLWEYNKLGSGYGSPIISNNKIYIVATEDSLSYINVIDLEGKLIYKSLIGDEWIVNYPGSRCAPTVTDNFIYVMTGVGDVVCLNKDSGQLKWKVNMLSDLDGVSPLFGYSEALVVYNDIVLCCPGGEINNVVALNRFNGEVVWACNGKGERPGYNPPKIIHTNQRDIFVTFSAYHLMGIDIQSGELLWDHEQVNTPLDKRRMGMGDTHANTVLFENNVIYYVEGDGNCAVALALSNDGKSIEQIWNNAVVDNYMGGILKIDNYIYSCGFSSNNLMKIDAVSGSVEDALSIGRGALIASDNMLYYYNMKGEVHLVDYQNDSMNSISSFKITDGSGEHFAHPVIHNGVLYIRHGNYLGAYSIQN